MPLILIIILSIPIQLPSRGQLCNKYVGFNIKLVGFAFVLSSQRHNIDSQAY